MVGIARANCAASSDESSDLARSPRASRISVIAPWHRPDRPDALGSGYPLEMAWSFGMTADPAQSHRFKAVIAPFTDERLIAQLDATDVTRGDGSHLEFVSFGLIAPELVGGLTPARHDQ